MTLIAESAGLCSRGWDDLWEGFVFQFRTQSDYRPMSLLYSDTEAEMEISQHVYVDRVQIRFNIRLIKST